MLTDKTPEPAGKTKGKGKAESSPPEDSAPARHAVVGSKPRWTVDLHRLFVEAVNSLGGPERATPESIQRRMNVPQFTLLAIQKHLQKYRLHLLRLKPFINNEKEKVQTLELEDPKQAPAYNILDCDREASDLTDEIGRAVPWVTSMVHEDIEKLVRAYEDRQTTTTTMAGIDKAYFLRFVNTLPHTIFTGNNVVAEDGRPVSIQLLDATTNAIVTLDPFASLKIKIVALDGDFISEDWSDRDFKNNVVRERDGRRPLVTGERYIMLRNGVGELSNVAFTDNSRWVRCGKFRLGARVVLKENAHVKGVRVREARSEAFVVKDNRGEPYKKHYPPRLEDEVWRLNKVAKDGAVHNRLSSYGINTVRQLLRANAIDRPGLMDHVGGAILTKVWSKIIEHANTCKLDENEFYTYSELEKGIRLLFNPVYKLVGAMFDGGQKYLPLDKLAPNQKVLVEHLKGLALSNPKNLILVDSHSGFSPFQSEHFQIPNCLDQLDLHRLESDHGKPESNPVIEEMQKIFRELNALSDKKEQMFEKVLTPSDVGKLNRLVIPKQYADSYLPPMVHSSNQRGVILRFDDRDGKFWKFRYSYWNSSQCYVLTKGWSRFVKEKNLRARDIISFHRDAKGRFYIDWKPRPNTNEDQSPYLSSILGNQKQPSLTTNLLPPFKCSSPFGMEDYQPSSCSYAYASDVNTWEHRGDSLTDWASQGLQLSEFMSPYVDAYDPDFWLTPTSDSETNLDLDLGLGMKSAVPTNLSGSLGTTSSLDLGNGMCSIPDSRHSGVLQCLQSQVISCTQLQEDTKRVGDRILDITESIQTPVTNYIASWESEPDHCNTMATEVLYISKSPSPQFRPHNFVSLFFPYCQLQQLWKGGEQLLVSLKHLDAKHSNLLWIPNLSKAQKLESLNLEGCVDLVGVSSIQHLTKLQHLNLKGCQSLKALPSLIRLKLLKTLDLSHCLNLTRLPPSLGCLPTLCELNLKNCEKLETLPRSVMHLMKSLETLNISGCSRILKSISRYENTTAPSSSKPSLDISTVPSTGATQEENLPTNSSSSPISKCSEDSCLELQTITAVQEDSAGDSRLQDLSSDVHNIRGEMGVESEDDDSMTIPLIISLLSKLRTALSSPPASSHASSSSSQDNNTLAINLIENNTSETEESKIVADPQMEDQQQLSKDVNHEDSRSEVKTLSANAELTCCQVEDCEVDLSSENTYHQQYKICEAHSNASEALVGNILQRFCHQCCRFHELIEFDEGERNCRNRLAGYHQKQRRQSGGTTSTKEEEHSYPEINFAHESSTAESNENEESPLNKRTRTSDDDVDDATEQNQPTQPLEPQLSFPSQDWDEANAIGTIEEDILAFIEQLSSSNYSENEVPESVLAWLAEMEQSVPETVRSMKSARAVAAANAGEKKKMDAMLVIGELELRLLDVELSRITEEEDEIDAELQRLMDKKREILQH